VGVLEIYVRRGPLFHDRKWYSGFTLASVSLHLPLVDGQPPEKTGLLRPVFDWMERSSYQMIKVENVISPRMLDIVLRNGWMELPAMGELSDVRSYAKVRPGAQGGTERPI
jgi:hypothetical protein